MLEHARDHHNHNASNHGHSSTATYWCADDDDNDARRQRLLIAKAGRGCFCRRHGPVAVSAFRKAARNSTYGELVATVVARSGFLRGRLCALGFLFLDLTYYRRDCLKLFAIAEIH